MGMPAERQGLDLRERKTAVKTDTVAVVGLGYVGLPVAALARLRAFRVVGFDIDAEKVRDIRAGKFPVLEKIVAEAFQAEALDVTDDAGRLKEAEVIIVAVPTPVDHEAKPDVRPLCSAVETVAKNAKGGVLLSIESTINPGICEEVLAPLLRSLDRNPENGDMYLVHCPERVSPGDKQWTVRNIPRVLGGYTAEATDRGMEFYQRLLEAPVTRLSSIRTAEAVKIVENAFRDVNIAFVNELAQSFDQLGIDVTEVIAGASTKPFAFQAHYPGCGVGGHCIPVDPYYLIDHAQNRGFEHRFLKLARDINKGMPRYTVKRLKDALHNAEFRNQNSGSFLGGVRVALLGLAYKKDVSDLRESPALDVERILREEGADVVTYDPFIPEQSSAATLGEALQSAVAVVVATDHTSFRQLRPDDFRGSAVRVIVDGKNCLDHRAFREAGYTVVGIGR